MAEPKYSGDERRKWHIKREISLGDLLAFCSAALAVVYAYTTLDKRISLLEDAKIVQKANDERQDNEALRYQQRIDATLQEMNRKLDRLIERR